MAKASCCSLDQGPVCEGSPDFGSGLAWVSPTLMPAVVRLILRTEGTGHAAAVGSAGPVLGATGLLVLGRAPLGCRYWGFFSVLSLGGGA